MPQWDSLVIKISFRIQYLSGSANYYILIETPPYEFVIFTSPLFFPERYRDLFAFQYRPKEGELVKQSSGWALYDGGSEYGRMGVPNQYWRLTTLNQHYEVCV